jgi:hypothetical protein
MKGKKPKKAPASGSRRTFLTTVAGSLAASAASGLPLQAAITAKATIDRERQLIETVVGRTVRQLMDPGIKEPPDLAAMYRQLGGRARFTLTLLSETFGPGGAYPLKPATAPDLKKIAKALEDKAKELADKKVPGLLNRVVKVEQLPDDAPPAADVVWTFAASPKFSASCKVSQR